MSVCTLCTFVYIVQLFQSLCILIKTVLYEGLTEAGSIAKLFPGQFSCSLTLNQIVTLMHCTCSQFKYSATHIYGFKQQSCSSRMPGYETNVSMLKEPI